jgi:hypothetical protein
MLWSDNEEFHQVNVPAEESRDYRNANMLWSDNEEFHWMNATHVDPDLANWNMHLYKYMSWSDNEEFHQVNVRADESRDYWNANMLWSDNEEFHRMNATHVDPDLVNSNMSWSDNKEFQKF